MLNGTIFQEVTGKNVADCQSTIEIWDAVKESRTVRTFGKKHYGNAVVTPRGGIFALAYHDNDIDKILLEI